MNRAAWLSIYRSNVSANEAVLSIAAQLSNEEFNRDFSPSHGTIRRMLLHMLDGEIYFPAVCRGEVPDTSGIKHLETWADIHARWQQASAEALAYFESLSDGDLERMVTMPLGEYRFTLPMWQVLLSFFSHSHHHRGELSILLSDLGYPLPDLDLIISFIKESGQQWPWD